ncbi:MAG: M28 family peptidase [Fidelibacterota bacterium]
MKHFLIILAILAACTHPPLREHRTGVSETVTADEVLGHIKFLADDELEGRFPGTDGSQSAIDYIASQFKAAGIEPGGDHGYFQSFDFLKDISLAPSNSFAVGNKNLEPETDYIPLAFSANGELTAPVVFVGYGFDIKEDSLVWNDYEGVDVDGKWALILRGDPKAEESHSEYANYAPLRKKIMVARDHGAAGVLFVSAYQDQFEPEELKSLQVNHRFSDSGILALQVKRTVADLLLAETGSTLKALQTRIDTTEKANSLALETAASAVIELKRTEVPVPNVIGFIPGNDPVLKDEYIIFGAHFDHLGYGGPGSGSLVPDTVAVHNGADDNASGVAGVIEIGERLSANRSALRRSVLLMCYNGEEEGLLGSKYFTRNPLIDLEKVSVMINMDMIGRYDEKVVVGGVGTSPDFETLLNEFNRTHGLTLNMSKEGFGPSDHASFYLEDVPVMFFFTGTHEDYHKPTDDWPKINADGEVNILNFIYDIALYLNQQEEKPVFTEAGSKEEQTGRRSFKVTFGIIPSYGSSADGMEIDGTKKEGPAAKAGLKKGDIIIAIDGGEIKDIYDYMYRLGELKVGQEVTVTVLRGEETLELKVQL